MELQQTLSMTINLYTDHIVRDAEWIEVAQTLRKVQEMRKNLETQESLLVGKLKALSLGENSRGGTFVFTKSFRKGSVEYAQIPQLQDVDLEVYRKKGVEVWKLDQILF